MRGGGNAVKGGGLETACFLETCSSSLGGVDEVLLRLGDVLVDIYIEINK
jgi:hypothetical protein